MTDDEALKVFTLEHITSEAHKKRLKKSGFIEYQSSIWCLSDKGKARAEELGFI